tara:strand:- start:313 stop:486 length:174 start_codon:yes stop_codon:yes gene_type:complete
MMRFITSDMSFIMEVGFYSYVTKIRDKASALRFICKAMKHHEKTDVITKNGLKFYRE